jgi:hypothetical protein
MTLSARASMLGGTMTILDFGFSILDCELIGLLYPLWLRLSAE